MNYYEQELQALKRAGRFRTREVVKQGLKDFASNDYLGLAHRAQLHQKSCETLAKEHVHAPKASLLVEGYHQIHKNFEDALCRFNGFEAGVVVGSGFAANIALIESLVRKTDTLFMDELYHASGVLASQIGQKNVVFFPHNDMDVLEDLLRNSSSKRNIIAVEGIYSMDGDLCDKRVFEIADMYDAILIVDEAHSSGVVGKRLLGVFDHYDITIQSNHVKMGTLGKAYGSFGAYILSSRHINEYLLNRAKPLIYATSLSLYDTVRAHHALDLIITEAQKLKEEIGARQAIICDVLGMKIDGLIAPVSVGNNTKVMQIKERLQKEGYSVGAIRQPTVPSAIVRIIARLGESSEDLCKLCMRVKELV